MENAAARGASGCVEKMEKEVAPQKRQCHRTTALNVISSLCSVASVAFCILLSINAADIKNRVVDLESGDGEHGFIRAPGYSMDDFNSLIEQRVDELLSQVRLHALSWSFCFALHTNCQRSPHTLWFHSFHCAYEWKMHFISHFSAPMRVLSRSGLPDKHHLNATAPQVNPRHPCALWTCGCLPVCAQIRAGVRMNGSSLNRSLFYFLDTGEHVPACLDSVCSLGRGLPAVRDADSWLAITLNRKKGI